MPDALPLAIFSTAQVRAFDRVAIEQIGIPGFELMTRAARAALAVLTMQWPAARRLAVYCGAGNNAGDGYVLARLAHEARLEVAVVAVGDPAKLTGDAAQAWRECAAAGVAIERWSGADASGADVIVDALLGTGLTRDLDAGYAAVVRHINNGSTPVLALDVPSGLDADTGVPRGDAVRAEVTITFVGLKQGLYLGDAPDRCGLIGFSDLGIPAEVTQDVVPVMQRLGLPDLEAALPARARSANKGTHGRLLLVGGGPGMGGAIRLAGEAALRSGAGLVYVATHPDNVGTVMAGRPELICRGVTTTAALDELVALADGIVLGPGLGTSAWARTLWRHVLAATALPLVVDADGLNLLAEAAAAQGGSVPAAATTGAIEDAAVRSSLTPSAREWLLTPHPGEAARLLGTTADAIQARRAESAAALARRFGATVVLKGACSLVAELAESEGLVTAVCDRGNPGLATAGTGDVLSGVLGALLVQTRDLRRAARAGVLLHALAGDAAAVEGERGLVAGDLFPHLRRWANLR